MRLLPAAGPSRRISGAIRTGIGTWRQAVVCLLLALPLTACSRGPAPLVVGSKNFTEQDILGELVAVWIERTTSVPVRRKLHLGGTFLCHQAIRNGDIDLYVEYTGTALTAVLKLPPARDPDAVFARVSAEYARRFGLVWTEPLGFDNTFAMLVRGRTADSLGISTLSEAAPFAAAWRAGFGYEFMERADGYPGLAKAYGFTLSATPRVMDLGLTYRALADDRVDLIAGNATDGQIAALGLRQLADDRGYFPPYFAAPVVRRSALERVPGLRAALARLGGRINTAAMREMNREVDLGRSDYRAVARAWVDAELAATRPAAAGHTE